MRAHLIVLGLALIALPRLATAAVVVAEPTGDAAPAFLAELKASLEAVAAEAPAELDAELKSSAALTEAGAELVVELVLSDGSDLVRETRTASRASALSQARAMARAAIRELFAPMPEPTTVSRKNAAPLAEPVSPPPLPEKFSRRKALAMTVLPTLFLPVVGVGLFMLSFRDSNDEAAVKSLMTLGISITSTGYLFGPSIGYFWVGRWVRALSMAGLRLGTLATGAISMALWFDSAHLTAADPDVSQPLYLALSIGAGLATIIISIVDAAFVGRAADRANAQWREQRKIEVQAAPMAWSNGRGDGALGFAVSGSF